jgi:hypothetical protein
MFALYSRQTATAGIACWLMAQGLRQLKMVTDWPDPITATLQARIEALQAELIKLEATA